MGKESGDVGHEGGRDARLGIVRSSGPLDQQANYLPCVQCDKILERLSYSCTLAHMTDPNQYCFNKRIFAVDQRPYCLEVVDRMISRADELGKGLCDHIGRSFMGNGAFQDRLMECTQMQCDSGDAASGGIFEAFKNGASLGFSGSQGLAAAAAASAAATTTEEGQ